MTNSSARSPSSILVIGATGRTGLEAIRKLAKHPSNPTIHAFCRDPNKLAKEDRALCDKIYTGSARSSNDIERALSDSQATWVLISVGNGDSVAKSDIRTASAEAVVEVLRKASFRSVRAMVVSSTGAGSSKIIVGMGIGALISYHLRHVLRDHGGQEAAFARISSRTVVIRATSLTDNEATGHLAQFGDLEKGPSIKTDRSDLADWMVKQICDLDTRGGVVVNMTSVKQ